MSFVASVEAGLTVQTWHCFSAWCIDVDTLDDEYFLLSQPRKKHAVIRVCEGKDLQKAKRLIQLPMVTVPWNLVACSVSNCLYVLHKTSDAVEILRVSREEEQLPAAAPFVTCSSRLVSRMCVSADGSLIVYQGPAPSTITTYNADGLAQRQIEFTKRLSFVRAIVSKSNGSVIIVSSSLTEISRDGDILYDYDCRVGGGLYRGYIHCAIDGLDHIMTVDAGNSVRLLDSDFNQAEVKRSDRWMNIRSWAHLYKLHYNRQRNEFMILDCCDTASDDISLPSQTFIAFNVTETIIPEADVQNDEQA